MLNTEERAQVALGVENIEAELEARLARCAAILGEEMNESRRLRAIRIFGRECVSLGVGEAIRIMRSDNDA